MPENEDLDISDEYLDELGQDNYGFVIGADGELKSVFMPSQDDSDVLPDNVQKILEVFGINNLNEERTLH